ncbi:Pentatricopeptide repeat-containing protein [Apostasia shenzhenica]|uniref:Pentatricopeptide repeat-containing protein n=1 Tax=Apostasia shenzhenica TaxID=1088818 RepID=A0A2I0AZE2_9ASPA|nr:Pentatricopeptide repeat-containing protein [Apostasia shenzhenica]
MAKPNHHLRLLRGCFSRKPRLLPPSPARLPFRRPDTAIRSTAGTRRLSTSDDHNDLRERIMLLSEKPIALPTNAETEETRSLISSLADDLLTAGHLSNLADDDDLTDLAAFLESRSAVSLLHSSPPGSAFVELLSRLKTRPRLAVQVFLWRLKQANSGVQVVPEEYAKAISLAGRAKNSGLARDLFTDGGRRGIRSTSMYNSLMTVYMYSSLTRKAVAVFEDLQRDKNCIPTISTYNLLLQVFGRSMLIGKLEIVLKQIHEHPLLSPNLTTYNTVIAAYLTAWMWDRMEMTYEQMIAGDVKPDIFTRCLMLRGYAYVCDITKMEKMYELVKSHVNERVWSLLRVMICAYCKSSDKDRVRKIEELSKHIPEGEYKPWLNILMIRLYAQEGLVDAMETLISEAVSREIRVVASGVMRSIISNYFHCGAVDRLSRFIKVAEYAGWKLCRSLYHTKMVMYGQRNQLVEMHGVLGEMEPWFDRTKRTFLIMYKAYSKAGRMSEAETIIGMMWKYGFLASEEVLIS